jgi:hypothetical protein
LLSVLADFGQFLVVADQRERGEAGLFVRVAGRRVAGIASGPELDERLSHHSLVQYRLPSTGELIPLLSIAPSKTDQERLLVIAPELADVLSAIITRVRSADGTAPPGRTHTDIKTTIGYKTPTPRKPSAAPGPSSPSAAPPVPARNTARPPTPNRTSSSGTSSTASSPPGDCGRAYSTPCIHEHSCIRCPLLRIDPAQRHRLEEIRDNLLDRIAEAEREGWAGEAEGLRVSLDAATSKLAQADLTAARRAEAVNLGIPAYRDIAAATITTPSNPRAR